MKSYGHQILSVDEIKRLAAEFTDEEILGSLREHGPYLYIAEVRGHVGLVGSWTDYGALEFMNDDAVLNYAQIDYMRRHGYPAFNNDAEMHAYALEHGWPKQRTR
jgi:hypothetical protein